MNSIVEIRMLQLFLNTSEASVNTIEFFPEKSKRSILSRILSRKPTKRIRTEALSRKSQKNFSVKYRDSIKCMYWDVQDFNRCTPLGHKIINSYISRQKTPLKNPLILVPTPSNVRLKHVNVTPSKLQSLDYLKLTSTKKNIGSVIKGY